MLASGLVAVDQEVPLDPQRVGQLDQRRYSALGELEAGHPFAGEHVAADPRQLGQQPGLGLALDQQPAAGEQAGPRCMRTW